MNPETITRLDLQDRLSRQTSQLKALLSVAARDDFAREVADDLCRDYMWACSDLADAIDEGVQALVVSGGAA